MLGGGGEGETLQISSHYTVICLPFSLDGFHNVKVMKQSRLVVQNSQLLQLFPNGT